GRQLMRLSEARAERELRGGPVDAGDMRVRDERDRAFSRDERGEAAERAALDANARGGEDDVVDVLRDGVRDLGVELAALLVEPSELRLVLREGPLAVLHSLPARVDVDVEPNRQRVSQRLAHPRRRDRPAAKRSDN